MLRRAAGVVLIVGAIVMVIGSRPVIDEFFGTTDQDERTQAILNNPGDWDYAMTMYSISAILAFAGLIMFAAAVNLTNAGQRLKRLAMASAITGVIGGLTWVYVSYYRATLPPEEVAANPNISFWGDIGFAPFMVAAVALAAYVTNRCYPKWGGKWGGRAVMFVTIVGLPVYFILPLAMFGPVFLLGILLLVARASVAESVEGISTPTPAG